MPGWVTSALSEAYQAKGTELYSHQALTAELAMVDDAKVVTLEDAKFRVRTTNRSKLREVDFQFSRAPVRGLEQNPETGSWWAQLARQGEKVMQFLKERITLPWWSWMERYGSMGMRLWAN